MHALVDAMNSAAMNNARQQRHIDRSREARGGDYPDWSQGMLPYQIRELKSEDDERNQSLQRMRQQQ